MWSQLYLSSPLNYWFQTKTDYKEDKSREHASAPFSLHALAVDCPRNDDRLADGGAFMYLYY